MYNEFKNPYHSIETNLEIAIGAIEFRDKTIKNLRQQIDNLRASLLNYEVEEVINANQYSHLNLKG